METKEREMISGSILGHKNKLKLHLDVANVPPFEETSSYLYVFRSVITAVFKKVVGTHFFFALFGPIGARFSPPPLRKPHGIKVRHIAKLNFAVP